MLSVNPAAMAEMSPTPGQAFVWKYCRMCALEVKQGVYIFGEEGKRLNIPEKIRKTVAILVLEEDSLPKKICTSCCTSLEAYTQFKDSVVDAQDKLSAIAKSIEKSQEQSLLQLRNKQVLKSPKRAKLYHSAIAPHSSCHVMLPTPSVISAPEPDLAEPAIECDEPPSSVASLSSDEEDNTTSKSTPECVNEVKADESIQVALQGPSPGSSTKHSIRETKTFVSPPQGEIDETKASTSNNKSPVYNGENSSGGSSSSSNNNCGSGSNSSNEISASENSQSEMNLLCGLCSSYFKDKDLLITHHVKVHGNETDPVFGCSICPRLTASYEALRQHMHRHRIAGVFKCPDCDKGFSTKEHLHVHITSKHNQAISKPVASGKLTNTNVPSVYERKKHASYAVSAPGTSAEGSSACSSFSQAPESVLCGSTEESSQVTGCKEPRHGELGSVVMQASVSPVKSDKGDVLANIKLDLNNSTVRNPATADSQDQGSQSIASSLDDEKDGYWKCEYCDKILRSKNGYDTHMATHKGRRYNCNQCGISYTQKSSLEHHIKVHHTNIDKEFECPECAKRFKTFRQLGWHKKTHEKPLTDVRCPQCEKLFKNMVSFKTHLKLHRGSKKFACAECPKAFYTKSKLQEHLNSHSGKRPFGCPVENCSKVFSCFSNYAKHFKKQHYSMIGPKGSMIPPPKMVESNNNVVPLKQPEIVQQKKKEVTTASTSTGVTKSEPGGTLPSHPSGEIAFQIGPPIENSSTQTQTVLRPLPGMYSSNNLGVQTSSTSSQTFTSQNSCSSIMLLPSSGHAHSSPHVASSTNENISLAHAQSVPLQSHSHHHHATNAHNSAHSAHNSAHAPSSAATQTQFQSPNHIQTVWQPVPSSKSYPSLPTINGLDLLDCAGTVHSAESLSNNNNHSHSQHQQSIPNTSINAAHHATSHSHSSVVHAHHGASGVAGSGTHIGSTSHHSSTTPSTSAPHSSTASSSGHNSVSSASVNIPSFGQNEPMELRYKDSGSFQEMPMELTKVFQRDPLELCVRQDFGNTQPLMDLSSRVVTVGGNSSMNSQSHYTSINNNGNGTSTSTSILTVPYKTTELVERELLNDFTAFRQPIDLISRSEDPSLCSQEGNLVDLSLRSSFQDQSASSFLRELIDLSSRSDSFHGEVNLTNKQHQSSTSNSHIHHSHSSGHLPKPTTSNSISGHQHHHNSHHSHHHHSIQSQSSSSGSAGATTLQTVMYPTDTSAMFN